MKLNADIIFDRLSTYIPAEITGYRDSALTIGRPEFYMGEKEVFKSGRLYVLRSESISRRAVVEKGSVLVCIGDVPQMSYFSERCCLIKINKDCNILQVFNYLQEIFNLFDDWNQHLTSIMDDNASASEMAEASLLIFENPILILDSGFRVIAQAGFAGPEQLADALDSAESDELSISALDKFLEQRDLLMHIREPLLLTTLGVTTLSMNFFDGHEYAGSVTVEYLMKPHKPGDDALVLYFSHFLSLAIKKNASIVTSERSILKRVFQNIVNDMPVDITHRQYLETRKRSRQFICAIIKVNNRFAQIPSEYICSKFDSLFPKSITFENRSNIISFIESDDCEEYSDYLTELKSRIELLVGAMDLKIGLSDRFSDPYKARLYYSQALAALENGMLSDPEKMCYEFDDYALMELLINAQSELPLDMYYSDGMRRLFKHDKESPTSYIETLHTYLNNNMNVTRTAEELYIHRSTLIERLARIERELGEDLNDPDVRLRIQLLLKAGQIQENTRRD